LWLVSSAAAARHAQEIRAAHQTGAAGSGDGKRARPAAAVATHRRRARCCVAPHSHGTRCEAVTMNDVDRLARAAANAFASYGHLTGRRKGELLRVIAGRLEANGEAIVESARQETSLGLPRLQGELARTCNQLRMFAALIEEGSWAGARIDHGKVDVRSMLRPIGPVAVFGASNFPLAFSVAGGDTASALAAGCPVI